MEHDIFLDVVLLENDVELNIGCYDDCGEYGDCSPKCEGE